MAVTKVTKDSQVYDTREELASKLLASAVKIQNKGTAEALKDGVLLCKFFSADVCYNLGGYWGVVVEEYLNSL